MLPAVPPCSVFVVPLNHAHTFLVHVLPAVDGRVCVYLHCPAALVRPGPLLAVPRQTQTAVYCKTVAYRFTQVLSSGYASKMSI